MKVSFMMADDCHGKRPELVKDAFWDEDGVISLTPGPRPAAIGLPKDPEAAERPGTAASTVVAPDGTPLPPMIISPADADVDVEEGGGTTGNAKRKKDDDDDEEDEEGSQLGRDGLLRRTLSRISRISSRQGSVRRGEFYTGSFPDLPSSSLQNNSGMMFMMDTVLERDEHSIQEDEKL